MNNTNLTPQEQLVLDHSVALWNAAVQLPKEHEDDINELRHHVHAIQNLIGARPTWRALNLKKAPATKLLIPKTSTNDQQQQTAGDA